MDKKLSRQIKTDVQDEGELHSKYLTDRTHGQPTENGDTKMEENEPPAAPDGGWGYMVLLGAALAYSNSGGLVRSATLIYQQHYEKFGRSATETAWVTALSGTCRFAASPLASFSCNRFGVRLTVAAGAVMAVSGMLASAYVQSLYLMYLTYGIMQGIGICFVVTSCLIVIGQYFDKKRAKANAVASMGVALGGATIAPLNTFLFREYGYTYTMVIMAGLFMHFFVAAALFRPLSSPHQKLKSFEMKRLQKEVIAENQNAKESLLKEQEEREIMSSTIKQAEPLSETREKEMPKHQTYTVKDNPKKSGCGQYFSPELLRERGFWSYTIFMTCTFLCRSSMNTFLAGLAEERNIVDNKLAGVLIATAATDLVLRFVAGVLFDLPFVRKRRLVIFSFGALLYTTFIVILPSTTNFESFIVVIILRNIFNSAITTQHATILSDIVGRGRFSSGVGLGRFFMGIGYLSGPSLGGFLRDQMGEYRYSYYFGAATLALGIFQLVAMNYEQFLCSKKSNEKEETEVVNV